MTEEETNVILFPKIVHPLSEKMSEEMLTSIKENYFIGASDFISDIVIANINNIVYHIDWDDEIVGEMTMLIQEAICALLYRTANLTHPLHAVKFGEDDMMVEETEDDSD